MGPTHGLHWSCCVFPYPPAAFLIEQRNSVLSWISVFLPKVYVGMPRSPCDGIGKPGLCAVSVTRAWNKSWVWSPHHGVSALRKRLLRACFLCLCSLPCEDTTGRPPFEDWKPGPCQTRGLPWPWTWHPPEFCERNVCCFNHPLYGN